MTEPVVAPPLDLAAFHEELGCLRFQGEQTSGCTCGFWRVETALAERDATIARLTALVNEQGEANGRLASWNVKMATEKDAKIAAMRSVVEAARAWAKWFNHIRRSAWVYRESEELAATVEAYEAQQGEKP